MSLSLILFLETKTKVESKHDSRKSSSKRVSNISSQFLGTVAKLNGPIEVYIKVTLPPRTLTQIP